MLPVPTTALDMQTLQWPAFTRTTTIVRGRPETSDGPAFNLYGSVQFLTDKQLQLLPEGYRSSGGLIIRTRDTVYFIDRTATSQEGRQTFLNAFGERWRITGLANWGPHGNYRKYLAEKYVGDTSPIDTIPAPTVPVRVESPTITTVSGGTPGALASIIYQVDGTTVVAQDPAPMPPLTLQDWLISGQPGDYEIMASLSSGTAPFTGPNLDEWHDLSVGTAPPGGGTAGTGWLITNLTADPVTTVLNIQIRLASDQTVLASGVVTLAIT